MPLGALLLAVSGVPSLLVNDASLSLMHGVMKAPASPFRGPVYEARPVIGPSELSRTLRYGKWGARLAPATWRSIEGRALIAAGKYREGADRISLAPSVRAIDALAAGNGYAVAGKRGDAIRLWTQASPSRPERLEIAKRLHAECVRPTYVIADRCRDAIEILNSVRPADRETVFLLASIHDSLDDHGVGAALMDRLLMRGNDPEAEDSKVIYLYRDGNSDAALAFAGRILSSRPSWAALFVRGSILLQRCDIDGAIRDFESAVAGAPSKDYRFTWIHFQLGTALWEKGDVNGALRQWREYARLQPGAPVVGDQIRQATEGRLPRRCPADGVRHAG